MILSSSYDLSDFSYFRKKGVKEFMHFSAHTLVGRTDPEAKVSVTEGKYVCSSFVQQDNLAAAAVTDDEYPIKVVHTCLEELLADFSAKIQRRVWENANESVEYPYMQEMLEKFSSPKDFRTDALSAVQEQVDETKIILHKTIESLLQRGEKLDDLVNKTDDLSVQTKTFYTSARKTNACCSRW